MGVGIYIYGKENSAWKNVFSGRIHGYQQRDSQ